MEPTPDAKRGDKLAHDLKNMITAVRMGCMLIEQSIERGETESTRELFEEVRDQLDAGGALVERVRALG